MRLSEGHICTNLWKPALILGYFELTRGVIIGFCWTACLKGIAIICFYRSYLSIELHLSEKFFKSKCVDISFILSDTGITNEIIWTKACFLICSRNCWSRKCPHVCIRRTIVIFMLSWQYRKGKVARIRKIKCRLGINTALFSPVIAFITDHPFCRLTVFVIHRITTGYRACARWDRPDHGRGRIAIGWFFLITDAQTEFICKAVANTETVAPSIMRAITRCSAGFKLFRCFCNDIYHTPHSIPAVKSRRRTPNDFYSFDVIYRQHSPF